MVLFTLPSDIDMKEFKQGDVKHKDVDRISGSGCARCTDCQSLVRIDVCCSLSPRIPWVPSPVPS